MAWEAVKRDDYMARSHRPLVSLSTRCVRFNVTFAKLAQLRWGMSVTYFAEPERFRLAMAFHEGPRDGAFWLTPDRLDAPGRSTRGMVSAIRTLRKRYDWLRQITRLEDHTQRRFTPVREGGLWIIQLFPAFECAAGRDAADVPAGVGGIYRYLRSDTGEVVYIGRGRVRARLLDPERRTWRFDRVEYSPVADPDDRGRWEQHWIDRHIARTGALPEYNRIRGG